MCFSLHLFNTHGRFLKMFLKEMYDLSPYSQNNLHNLINIIIGEIRLFNAFTWFAHDWLILFSYLLIFTRCQVSILFKVTQTVYWGSFRSQRGLQSVLSSCKVWVVCCPAVSTVQGVSKYFFLTKSLQVKKKLYFLWAQIIHLFYFIYFVWTLN